MTQKLKKAENLFEAYQVFETQKPLTPDDREFYVELYQKDIRRLRNDLILNSIPNKSFFVTGQSGNGKTTAMNFLPNERVFQRYDIKYLNGRDLFKLDDVDIIDVILMIGFTVVRGNKELEKRFLKELQELKEVKLKRLEKEHKEQDTIKDEAGAKSSFGAKLSLWRLIQFDAGILASFKLEKEKRDAIRHIFTLDKRELIEKINAIIKTYYEEVLEGEKQLLLVIDDLEKIRNQEQAKALFVDNHYAFEAIEATKVVTFPVHLVTRYAMYQDASKFGIRITKNPFDKDRESVEAETNRQKFKDIIRQRLANQELVRDDAIHKAIKFSGGNLRFLLSIMQKAVRNAINLEAEETGTETIVPRDVESAVEEMSSLASLSVMNRIKVLRHVMEHHYEPDDENLEEDFTRSILDNTIFAYFNGHPWYELNPIIQESVKIYSRTKETS